jgi:hypothetical protein
MTAPGEELLKQTVLLSWATAGSMKYKSKTAATSFLIIAQPPPTTVSWPLSRSLATTGSAPWRAPSGLHIADDLMT